MKNHSRFTQQQQQQHNVPNLRIVVVVVEQSETDRTARIALLKPANETDTSTHINFRQI